MKTSPIIRIVIGIIAIVGAAVTVYLLFVLMDAVSLLSTADPSTLPGTDLAGLQANARLLGNIVIVGWIWTISVLASGAFTVKSGVDDFRKRK